MSTVVEFLLVGRTPLGSSLRAVLVTIMLTLFWNYFIEEFWPHITVSLITALAVVVAAHLLSRRDNAPGPSL